MPEQPGLLEPGILPPPVGGDVRVLVEHGDDLEIGLTPERGRQERGDRSRAEVLMLDVDQPTGAFDAVA